MNFGKEQVLTFQCCQRAQTAEFLVLDEFESLVFYKFLFISLLIHGFSVSRLHHGSP